MQLNWHPYKYYPYERVLAVREIEAVLQPDAVSVESEFVKVQGAKQVADAHRLVYFSEVVRGNNSERTVQSTLERVNGNGPNRQSTRYSAHGLHEYKGKFNPQVAKAIINIFGAHADHKALDPFCGSGTSLVECAHMGLTGVGTDINPLAVFIANAKIDSLGIPAGDLESAGVRAATRAARYRAACRQDERGVYLASWFEGDVLREIEALRRSISEESEAISPVLLAIASNVLRDYSLQEPSDLRIRRRKSPMPAIPLMDAFRSALGLFTKRLADSQSVLGLIQSSSRAVLADCRQLAQSGQLAAKSFDLALTSPPYATALPYIDTQRLSLVWLGLLSPSEVMPLEAALVGSREVRGPSKRELLQRLQQNSAGLPAAEAELCVCLQAALTEEDGFRRQAVPQLLYRYFSDMRQTFESVRTLLKPGAPFGLIVGGNHTVIGGTRFDIRTPDHLASVAQSVGWTHQETLELQTYQRFGLHASNATQTEALLILRA